MSLKTDVVCQCCGGLTEEPIEVTGIGNVCPECINNPIAFAAYSREVLDRMEMHHNMLNLDRKRLAAASLRLCRIADQSSSEVVS